jgi:hypothetical protein
MWQREVIFAISSPNRIPALTLVSAIYTEVTGSETEPVTAGVL